MEMLSAMGIIGGGFFTLLLILLAILVPFFIYGTNNRTKQTAMLLKRTNQLLEDILDRLPAADPAKEAARAAERTSKTAGWE